MLTEAQQEVVRKFMRIAVQWGRLIENWPGPESGLCVYCRAVGGQGVFVLFSPIGGIPGKESRYEM